MSAGLRFVRPHRYRLDDAWVPSVTGISRTGGGCDGLVRWATGLTAEYAFDNRERLDGLDRAEYLDLVSKASKRRVDAAAQAGVEVHRIASLLLADLEVQVPDDLVPYVRQAVDLIERHDLMPLLVEVIVGSRRHQYAGRLDMITRLITVERGEHLALVDWKTGKSVWSDVALQLAGYAFAEFAVVDDPDAEYVEQPLPLVDAYYVAHVGPNSAELLPIAVDGDTFDAFLASRRRYEFDRIKVDEIVGAAVQHPPVLLDGTGGEPL